MRPPVRLSNHDAELFPVWPPALSFTVAGSNIGELD
jgi:hypothetical protein